MEDALPDVLENVLDNNLDSNLDNARDDPVRALGIDMAYSSRAQATFMGEFSTCQLPFATFCDPSKTR